MIAADPHDNCNLEEQLKKTKELIASGINPFILGNHFSQLRKSIAECRHIFHIPDFELLRWLDEREALLGHFLPFSTPEELEESCLVLNSFQPFTLQHLNGEELFVSALMSEPQCLTVLNDYVLIWVNAVRERLYSQPSPMIPKNSFHLFQTEQEQR